MNEKLRKGAGIAAMVLLVGGGTYMAGGKTLGTCGAKAKATNAAMTTGEATTCEKVHASAMASTGGNCGAKATNAAVTTASVGTKDDCCDGRETGAAATSTADACGAKATHTVMTSVDGADACPYLKAHAAKATAVSAQAGDCPEGSASCPMNEAGKGNASRKVENKKTEPKAVMASMVPPPAASK